MIVYVEADETHYALKGGITDSDWIAVVVGEALPDQTGQAGKVLSTDGTTASWEIPSGGGGGKNYFDSESADFEGGTVGSWGVYRDGAFVNYNVPEVSNAALNFYVGNITSKDWSAQKCSFDSEILTTAVFTMVRFGSPNGSIRCDVVADASGQPGSTILFSSNTFAMSTIPTGTPGPVTFTFTNANRLSGSFWLVLKPINNTNGDLATVYDEPISTGEPAAATFNSGSTWTVSATRRSAATINTLKRGASTNLSLAVETTNPLAGTTSLALSKAAANAQNEYMAIRLDNIDRIDPRIQFFGVGYDATGANYASEDIELEFYQYPTGERLYVGPDNPGRLLKAATNIKGLPVYIEANTTSVEVFARVRTTNATAYTVYFDEFRLGPAASVSAVYRNEAVINVGTSGNFTGGQIRVGRIGGQVTLSIVSRLTWAGTLQAPASAAGLIPPWARPPANFRSNVVNRVAAGHVATVYVNPNGAIEFAFDLWTGAGANITDATSLNERFSISYAVEDTSSQTLTTNELGVQTGRFRASRNGTNQTGVNPNNNYAKILFNSVSSASDFQDGLAYDATNSRFVCVVPGGYSFGCNALFANANVLNNRYALAFYVNGSIHSFGQETVPLAANQFAVGNNADIKLSTGDIVEPYLFGAGNNSVNTLTLNGGAAFSYFTGRRIPDFTVLGAVRNDELITATSTPKTVTPSTQGTFLNITGNSITLTPGRWRLSGTFEIQGSSGSALATYFRGMWTTTNGNDVETSKTRIDSTNGLISGFSEKEVSTGGSRYFDQPMPTIIIERTSPITLFLTCRVDETTLGADTIGVTAYLTAERIR
jgi:hypothetical protein